MGEVEKKTNPVLILFLGAALIIGGFTVMNRGKVTVDKADDTLTWPYVIGKIVKSSVIRRRAKDGDRKYYADIHYTYMVSDVTYVAKQRRIGPQVASSNSEGAYKITRKYPRGRRVKVYYNIDDPQDAVIEPGIFKEAKRVWYIGLGLIAAGIVTVFWIIIKVFFIV